MSFDGYLSHKEDDSFLLDSESANPTVVSADIAITNQNVISYINKILVTYPNSNVKNSETYSNSIYSGLMYNNYA